MASTNGLQNNSLVVNTIDGLTTIYATSIYDNGILLDPGNYVPYSGAVNSVNLGGQELQTSFVPVNGSDVVNLTALQASNTYLLGVTALNYVPYTGATGDTTLGTYKMSSSSAPTTGNNFTNKTYVDGQISAITTAYVPYTGATTAVNLGSFGITAQSVGVGNGTTAGIISFGAPSGYQPWKISTDASGNLKFRTGTPALLGLDATGNVTASGAYYGTTAQFSAITSATPSLALGVDGSGNLNSFPVPTSVNLLPLNNTWTGTNQFNQPVYFPASGGFVNSIISGSATLAQDNSTNVNRVQFTGSGGIYNQYIYAHTGTSVNYDAQIQVSNTTAIPTTNNTGQMTIYAGSVALPLTSIGGGVNPPATGTSGGTGDRLILYPGSVGVYPYSFGINAGVLWYSCPTGTNHRWYIGGVNNMTLNSGGTLVLALANGGNHLQLTNSSTNAMFMNFNSNGGAGSAYIGMDSSTGSGLFGSGIPYSFDIGTSSATPICFFTNNVTTPRMTISASGNISASGDISCGLIAPSTGYGRQDNRNLNPKSINAGTEQFFFASWNNDGGAPYADAIGMNGWTDSSGGLTNVLMVRKDTWGIRQYQGTFGSTTAFVNTPATSAQYMDCCMKGVGDNTKTTFQPIGGTWNVPLNVGSGTDSGTAQVITTNGNLHLDPATGASMYLGGYRPPATLYMYASSSIQKTTRYQYQFANVDGDAMAYFQNGSTGANAYMNIIIANNASATNHFMNSSTRSPDGWYNCYTIRNDSGGGVRFMSNNGGFSSYGASAYGATYCNAIVNYTNTTNLAPTSWAGTGYTVFCNTSQPSVNQPGLGLGTNNSSACYITALSPAIVWLDLPISANQITVRYAGTLVAYTQAGVGWVNVSDEREKHAINDLKTSRSLERILKCKTKYYKRKYYDTDKEGNPTTPVPQATKDNICVGLLAQDVLQHTPHSISTWKNEDIKETDEDDTTRFGISYNDFVVHLIGAVQEHNKTITTQASQITALQQQLSQLANQFQAYITAVHG